MADFPIGGDANATRQWLNDNGYGDFYEGVTLKADALLGMTREDIMAEFPGEAQRRGVALVGFLNTARQIATERRSAGKFSQHIGLSC
jgi:hypothetical protein